MRCRELAIIGAFAVGCGGGSKTGDAGNSATPADASTQASGGSRAGSGGSGAGGSGAGGTSAGGTSAGSGSGGSGAGGRGGSGGGNSDASLPLDAASAEAGPARDAAQQADAGPKPATCVGQMPYTSAYVSDPKLCVYVFAENLGSARQMAFAPNGDLFVNNGEVTALWDADNDGTSEASERSSFATASGIAHGLAFSRDGAFVYAASPTTVYRWPYTTGKRSGGGPAEVVVKGIPSGGHSSRTLAFDSQGRLIMSVGSEGNVDSTQQQWATRSQVRRYTLPATIPDGGVDFSTGEVVASGMRNEVGLYVDAQDRIWGAENERDNLNDADLGGDIHNDNPGEEINLIDGQGTTFYGYPLCYSEFKLNGGNGAGTQWADDSIAAASRKTDAWCRDRANVRPPAFTLQAHWAPLGILQYTDDALPFNGDFIVASHGSWNRDPATGRLLARGRVENGAIVAVDAIVGARNASGQLEQGMWDARPVDVRQGPDGALYFSDDLGRRVFKIGYMND